MSDTNDTGRSTRTTVVEKGGTSPITWVVIILIVALLAFGAWWLFMRGDVPQSERDGVIIEIETQSPDLEIEAPAPETDSGGGEDSDSPE